MQPPEPSQKTAQLETFLANTQRESQRRIQALHHLSKKLWKDRLYTPHDLQTKCLEAWDKLTNSTNGGFTPLILVHDNEPVSDLIFGSGTFSTGDFQATQYREVAQYTDRPPVVLKGLAANRSQANGCRAAEVSAKHKLPLAELDFSDWYHQNISAKEKNPIQATRYWFPPDTSKRPTQEELSKRFDIRQNQYHRALGDTIAEKIPGEIDIASARGYSFQFCSPIFRHQEENPHINDTHPADLSYVDPTTRAKLYPGWQSAAVELMVKDGHQTFRGSLIEVLPMDNAEQIYQLDEGALLALGQGLTTQHDLILKPSQIQDALKLLDDNVFCTLAPTGLILTWGISKKPASITFQDLAGNTHTAQQHQIAVGNEIRSGIQAWGKDLQTDIQHLERSLLY